MKAMLRGLQIVNQLHFSREFRALTYPFLKWKIVEMTGVLGLSVLKLSSVLGAHMNN